MRAPDEPGPPLLSERFRRAAPLIILVVALTLALQVSPGPMWLRLLVFAGAVVVVLWARNRRKDDDYGPGAG